ncbi:hypothetical protein MCOR15_005299 [Pyricularia oryzae]|nr:hypothetical protein MCOR15_005299 [Pyricularia oryzae]
MTAVISQSSSSVGGGGHQGCSGFATSPLAARASSSGDPDRALFSVHNDAGRVGERGGVNKSLMAWRSDTRPTSLSCKPSLLSRSEKRQDNGAYFHFGILFQRELGRHLARLCSAQSEVVYIPRAANLLLKFQSQKSTKDGLPGRTFDQDLAYFLGLTRQMRKGIALIRGKALSIDPFVPAVPTCVRFGCGPKMLSTPYSDAILEDCFSAALMVHATPE